MPLTCAFTPSRRMTDTSRGYHGQRDSDMLCAPRSQACDLRKRGPSHVSRLWLCGIREQVCLVSPPSGRGRCLDLGRSGEGGIERRRMRRPSAFANCAEFREGCSACPWPVGASVSLTGGVPAAIHQVVRGQRASVAGPEAFVAVSQHLAAECNGALVVDGGVDGEVVVLPKYAAQEIRMSSEAGSRRSAPAVSRGRRVREKHPLRRTACRSPTHRGPRTFAHWRRLHADDILHFWRSPRGPNPHGPTPPDHPGAVRALSSPDPRPHGPPRRPCPPGRGESRMSALSTPTRSGRWGLAGGTRAGVG